MFGYIAMFASRKQKDNDFYHFFYNNLRITKSFKFLKIDFEKPWYNVFFQVKWVILATFVYSIYSNLYFTLIPVVLGYIFSSGNFNLLYYFFAGWAGLMIFAFFINPLWIRLYSQIVGSIKFAAQNHFLKVDPIFHSTRSSGQIIAKVTRGSQAYDEVIFLVTEDIFPIIVKSVAAASTLFIINTYLGLIGLGFVTFTLIFSMYFYIKVEKVIEPKIIETTDLDKQIEVENLAQVQLIRSIFATETQIKKANSAIQKGWSNVNLKSRVNHFIGQVSDIFLFIFLITIFAYVLGLVEQNQVSLGLATGVLISLTLNLADIMWIGNKVGKLLKSIIEAQDLFKFIRGFGKQSYPVLKEDIL